MTGVVHCRMALNNMKTPRVQIQLRVALVILTCACVIFATYAAWNRSSMQLNDLVQQLESRGMEVQFACYFDGDGRLVLYDKLPRWKQVIIDVYGEAWVSHVVAVGITSKNLRDDDIALLQRVNGLKVVNVHVANPNEADVEALRCRLHNVKVRVSKAVAL